MSTEREKTNILENNTKSALLLSNSVEEANADKKQKSDICEHKTSVGKSKRERKCGRKKKGYSMGTYPFLSSAKKYLEDQKPYLAEITRKERERKFKHLNRELVKLWKEKKISTTNPKKLSEKDIGAILFWMREEHIDGRTKQKRPLDQNTQQKYIGHLTRLLRYVGNSVIDRMREKGTELPKKVLKKITVLSEDKIQQILNAAERIQGWHGEILKFSVSMYAYTGLRPKELRLAQIEDLETSDWTIWVRHPKGEGKYGEQRTVPIPPVIRSYVQKYLTARAKELRKRKINDCEQLIPYFTKEGAKYFLDAGFRNLKCALEKALDISFKQKDFRSSYAQNLRDRGVDIDAVSKALGHSSTETTEKYYARIRDSSMFEKINRAWEKPQNIPSTESLKKPQMKNENWLSGYA